MQKQKYAKKTQQCPDTKGKTKNQKHTHAKNGKKQRRKNKMQHTTNQQQQMDNSRMQKQMLKTRCTALLLVQEFFQYCFVFQFLCRFGTLVFPKCGLKVLRKQTSPPSNAAAATSRLRFAIIIFCRTRSRRALRAAASPSSRTNAQLRIALSRCKDECTHFVIFVLSLENAPAKMNTHITRSSTENTRKQAPFCFILIFAKKELRNKSHVSELELSSFNFNNEEHRKYVQVSKFLSRNFSELGTRNPELST